jgi:hypothetical protein
MVTPVGFFYPLEEVRTSLGYIRLNHTPRLEDARKFFEVDEPRLTQARLVQIVNAIPVLKTALQRLSPETLATYGITAVTTAPPVPTFGFEDDEEDILPDVATHLPDIFVIYPGVTLGSRLDGPENVIPARTFTDRLFQPIKGILPFTVLQQKYHGAAFGIAGLADVTLGEFVTIVNSDDTLKEFIITLPQTVKDHFGFVTPQIPQLVGPPPVITVPPRILAGQEAHRIFGDYFYAEEEKDADDEDDDDEDDDDEDEQDQDTLADIAEEHDKDGAAILQLATVLSGPINGVVPFSIIANRYGLPIREWTQTFVLAAFHDELANIVIADFIAVVNTNPVLRAAIAQLTPTAQDRLGLRLGPAPPPIPAPVLTPVLTPPIVRPPTVGPAPYPTLFVPPQFK